MAYRDLTKLSVWKNSFDLLIIIYRLTKKYPNDERFGLVSNTRRSANSVVHNIPEGFGRYEKRDKTRFYKISRASAYEIISQILVASALNYISTMDEDILLDGYENIIEQLDKLIKTVETR